MPSFPYLNGTGSVYVWSPGPGFIYSVVIALERGADLYMVQMMPLAHCHCLLLQWNPPDWFCTFLVYRLTRDNGPVVKRARTCQLCAGLGHSVPCLSLDRWLHGNDCCNVQDVFLVDTNKFCFVWIGGGASPTEKKSGLGYAHVRICTACWERKRQRSRQNGSLDICVPARASGEHASSHAAHSSSSCPCSPKVAFHDTDIDTDTNIFARMSVSWNAALTVQLLTSNCRRRHSRQKIISYCPLLRQVGLYYQARCR